MHHNTLTSLSSTSYVLDGACSHSCGDLSGQIHGPSSAVHTSLEKLLSRPWHVLGRVSHPPEVALVEGVAAGIVQLADFRGGARPRLLGLAVVGLALHVHGVGVVVVGHLGEGGAVRQHPPAARVEVGVAPPLSSADCSSAPATARVRCPPGRKPRALSYPPPLSSERAMHDLAVVRSWSGDGAAVRTFLRRLVVRDRRQPGSARLPSVAADPPPPAEFRAGRRPVNEAGAASRRRRCGAGVGGGLPVMETAVVLGRRVFEEAAVHRWRRAGGGGGVAVAIGSACYFTCFIPTSSRLGLGAADVISAAPAGRGPLSVRQHSVLREGRARAVGPRSAPHATPAPDPRRP